MFQVKGRPETKALPILVSSIEQAATLARELPNAFLVLAHAFWPGALTIVVEATHRLPLKVTGNSGRVALRWARSALACALIDAVGNPITGTSANLSGFPACTSAERTGETTWRTASADSGFGRYRSGARVHDCGIDGKDWWVAREGSIPEERNPQSIGIVVGGDVDAPHGSKGSGAASSAPTNRAGPFEAQGKPFATQGKQAAPLQAHLPRRGYFRTIESIKS